MGTDSANSNRMWDNLYGRLWAPITTLWIFALSTGEGFTAMLLRNTTLSDNLAPNAYNCFLFHQMVGQWYYAATRNGTMWNWWRFKRRCIGFHQDLVLLNGMNTFMLLSWLSCSRSS